MVMKAVHIKINFVLVISFFTIFNTSYGMDIIIRYANEDVYGVRITPYNEKRDHKAMMNMIATEPTYLLGNQENPIAHRARYIKSDGKTLQDILTWTHILKTRVLTSDNKPVGFIQYTFLMYGTSIQGRIDKLVIEKEYRLKGFGKHLLESAITDLEKNGATRIYAAVDHPDTREFLKEQDIQLTIIPKSN